MTKGKITTRIAAFLLLLHINTDVPAQDKVARNYPHGYFRNPLNIPMELTANFGELRSNHWHMGLDIRTNQKVNLPVYAAAEGYVAQIGIRPLSFGKFIILHHPNGYSTLYAHLNSFYPGLQQFVEEQQKKQESWAVELDFTKNQFPVKKGDLIAYSGNTGGSQGPHLHFEIRETKTGRSLNPLLFNLELKDRRPPVITRLAIYDRSRSTYQQTPVIYPVKKTDSGYFTIPRNILTGFKKLSFAISAYDKLDNSPTNDGIYSALIYHGAIPLAEFVLDRIDYNESIYINAQVDYRHQFNTGISLQHLSRLPGDRGHIAHEIEGNGIIELSDTTRNSIRIQVMDAHDNLSELFLTVQYSDSLAGMMTDSKTLPEKKLNPGQAFIMEEKEFEVFLPENSLYDTAGLVYYKLNTFLPGAVSAQHRLNDPSIPVHDFIRVRIKPTIEIPDDQKDKLVIVREWQGRRSVKKASWQIDHLAAWNEQQGWISASFGDFGNFQAFVDLAPPQINAPGPGRDTIDMSRSSRIVFSPTDNYGIRSFRAELDNRWLMFSNDKGRDYVYIFDEQFSYGVNELKVTVTDLAGNNTTKTWWVKRNPYTPPPKRRKGKR